MQATGPLPVLLLWDLHLPVWWSKLNLLKLLRQPLFSLNVEKLSNAGRLFQLGGHMVVKYNRSILEFDRTFQISPSLASLSLLTSRDVGWLAQAEF